MFVAEQNTKVYIHGISILDSGQLGGLPGSKPPLFLIQYSRADHERVFSFLGKPVALQVSLLSSNEALDTVTKSSQFSRIGGNDT
jgi:hypothetical protein